MFVRWRLHEDENEEHQERVECHRYEPLLLVPPPSDDVVLSVLVLHLRPAPEQQHFRDY